MFAQPITFDNLPKAIGYLIEQVEQLRQELKEYKQPQQWVTMGEAARITGSCKKSIVADRVEFVEGAAHIPGTIRFIKKNHTHVIYNRNDLLTWITK